MPRNRLTRRAENGEFVDNLNRPERKDVDTKKYETTDSADYEKQDLHHDWKNDNKHRDEINLPRIARIHRTTKNAVKLAVALLGDKVSDEVIEAQARDFLRLGEHRIEQTLKRFVETSSLYEKEVKAEEPKVEVKAEAKEEKTEEVKDEETKTEEVKDEETKTEAPKTGEVKAEEVKVEEPKVEIKAEETKTEEVKNEVKEEKTEEVKTEEVKAETTDVQAETKLDEELPEVKLDIEGSERELEGSELDAELKSVISNPGDISDDELSNIFADDSLDTVADTKKTETVREIGTQPIRAASANADDLASLWECAPDVSKIW